MTREEKIAEVKSNIDTIINNIRNNSYERAETAIDCGALKGNEHPYSIAKLVIYVSALRGTLLTMQEEKEVSNLRKFL